MVCNPNSDAMDAVFGAGGCSRLFLKTVNIDEVFDEVNLRLPRGFRCTGRTGKLLIAITLQWRTGLSGGHLLLNSAPNEGDGMSFGLMV